MRIAIIGAGFTGLAAAVKLVDDGHEVVVFEAGEKAGGLAAGFRPSGWDWNLELFYHHIFANDKAIIKLAKKVGWPAFFETPVTSSFIKAKEVQLDTPISLLKFVELSIWARVRMGMGLAMLKLIPNGQFLEKYKVVEMLPKLVGGEGYVKIWLPLLRAKFGKFVNKVNMAWFWARVYKRTARLGYFIGGFEKLAEKCGEYITKKGGKVIFNSKIATIRSDLRDAKVRPLSSQYQIQGETFDKVLITTPAPLADKLIGKGKIKWPEIDYLWGQTLVLEMKESLLQSYWLNILEKDWPFLVAVEHTNFINKKHYGNKVVIYLGNYLENRDKRLEMSEKELLDLYAPYIQIINPLFKKKWVKRMWKWQAPFAQPVFPIGYSAQIPGIRVKDTGIFVTNMSMVYPFDRGTNYAVELGEECARMMSA